ncbi:unnamed protein product [Schistosoma mattheei]|uniref:Uncharacterized protein n=1 Tax=Schistosoma mattheei TaxID=31246 RepID=A0A3P8F8Q8_9TREM|nr:unnamed protein product [Schistosoma mattheei]
MGLVRWMYLYLRVDVHYRTWTQYRSLQTPSCYPVSYRVLTVTCLCDGVQFKLTWYCLLGSLH